MKTYWLIGIVLFLGITLGIVYVARDSRVAVPVEQACTMEAKMCPDGSAVGRTGPNCEFAACPVASSTTPGGVHTEPTTPQGTGTGVETRIARLGQTVSAFDVSITPLEVTEDSRCPVDVQCIWAGRVVVRARVSSALGTSEMTFTLGQRMTTEADSITLSGVTPAKASGAATPSADYRLTFDISRR